MAMGAAASHYDGNAFQKLNDSAMDGPKGMAISSVPRRCYSPRDVDGGPRRQDCRYAFGVTPKCLLNALEKLLAKS